MQRIGRWKVVAACIAAFGTCAVMVATIADEPGKPVSVPEIPYPKSDLIHGVRWLGEQARNSTGGDTWSTTWAGDDNLYTVGDDNMTGYNFSIFKVEGMPPNYTISIVNKMEDYGKTPEDHWWKGSGLISIDGALYLGIYAQSNPSTLSASKVSYNAENSSIIKSTDYGQTWSSSAKNSWDKPMFPKKEFPTPFFVQYGKGYAGAMDDYVYVCSNDGGWNNWNRMLLARVARAKFGTLDRHDWEFFVSANNQNTPAWTSDVTKAGSIFEYKRHTGMTGIQFVPALKRFILAQWSYVAMDANGPFLKQYFAKSSLPFPWQDDAAHESMDQTMLCIFEAPKPWGPWKLAHVQVPWGPAFYSPSLPSKWFQDDGKRAWMTEGGNFRDQSTGGYQFITQKMEWITGASP